MGLEGMTHSRTIMGALKHERWGRPLLDAQSQLCVALRTENILATLRFMLSIVFENTEIADFNHLQRQGKNYHCTILMKRGYPLPSYLGMTLPPPGVVCKMKWFEECLFYSDSIS